MTEFNVINETLKPLKNFYYKKELLWRLERARKKVQRKIEPQISKQFMNISVEFCLYVPLFWIKM